MQRVLLLLALLGLAPSVFADSLKEIADDYYRRLVSEAPYLQLKHGVKVESLPDLSEAHAKELATFEQSLLDRLAFPLIPATPLRIQPV